MDLTHVHWILQHPKDFYGILQLERSADDAAIKRAYRQLMLQLHPDKVHLQLQAVPAVQRAEMEHHVEQACRHVRQSYDVLKDEKVRATYLNYGLEAAEKYLASGESPEQEMQRIKRQFFFLICYRGSRWTHQEDIVQHKFADVVSEIEGALPSEELDDLLFFRSVAAARSKTRRLVYRLFVIVCCVFLFTTLLGRRWASSSSCCSKSGTVCLPYALVATTPLQADANFAAAFGGVAPPSALKGKKKTKRKKPTPSMATFNITIDKHCLLKAYGAPSYKQAADVYAACAAASSPTKPDANTVSVPYYAVLNAAADGKPLDARGAEAIYVQYYARKCVREHQLHWSSRQRFQETATLPSKLEDHVVSLEKEPAHGSGISSNNTYPRKYRKKRWVPRYENRFSITNEAELFQYSAMCAFLNRNTSSYPRQTE